MKTTKIKTDIICFTGNNYNNIKAL